jgi:hypothetical protein
MGRSRVGAEIVLLRLDEKMKPTLHILTTCFRVYNLPVIAERIAVGFEWFDLHWHITLDGTNIGPTMLQACQPVLALPGVEYDWRDHWPGGLAPTSDDGVFSPCATAHNQHLDQIKSGWVFIHDDDTVLHPHFFQALRGNIEAQPQLKGWLFSIEDHQWKRACAPQYVRKGYIDLGQYVLERSLIGNTRYTTAYGFDGIFMEEIYQRNPELVGIDQRFLIYHNWLR